jgi:Tol biopolymer transport system component
MTRCFALFLLFPLLVPTRIVAADLKPLPLGLNTQNDEDDPHISSNGLQMFYTSNANKKYDIFLTTRKTVYLQWTPGKPLEDYVRTETDDRSTFLTSDSRYPQFLYYATRRDKSNDNFDIFAAVRHRFGQSFSAPTPINSVCTAEDELHPWLTADGRSLYFSRKTKEGWRVMVATRQETWGAAGFGEPVFVKGLPVNFCHATLGPDGRTMYLQGPLDKDRLGLFRSVRGTSDWSKPEPLAELNCAEAPTGDRSPCLTRDGSRLYFASDRPGGKGGLDLWIIPTEKILKR